MRYVIELGERRKQADSTFTWISHGFYNLYEPNGGPMIVVEKIEDAYHFDKRAEAENVIGGEPRIAGVSRIVERA